MSQGLPDIRSLSQAELTQALVEMGEKPFRTKQVSEWLWTHAAGSFEEMTSLGKGLRSKLEESFTLRRIDRKGHPDSVRNYSSRVRDRHKKFRKPAPGPTRLLIPQEALVLTRLVPKGCGYCACFAV